MKRNIIRLFLLASGLLVLSCSLTKEIDHFGHKFEIDPQEGLLGRFEAFIFLSMNGGHDRIIFYDDNSVLWEYEHIGDIVDEDGSVEHIVFETNGKATKLSNSEYTLFFEDPTFYDATEFRCTPIKSEEGQPGVFIESMNSGSESFEAAYFLKNSMR